MHILFLLCSFVVQEVLCMKTFDSLFKALNNELKHQKLVGHKHPLSDSLRRPNFRLFLFKAVEVHMLCNRWQNVT